MLNADMDPAPMAWLAALQATPLATWVRESESLWGYPLILTLHTVGLSLLVGGSAALDLRLLGVARAMPIAPLRGLFPIMWAGFAINATSGVLLFMGNATEKAVLWVFWVKLACIALGVVTMRLLQTSVFSDRGALASGGLPPVGKRLAVASLLLWAGAITAGRWMAYF